MDLFGKYNGFSDGEMAAALFVVAIVLTAVFCWVLS